MRRWIAPYLTVGWAVLGVNLLAGCTVSTPIGTVGAPRSDGEGDGLPGNDPNSEAMPNTEAGASQIFSLRVARQVDEPFPESRVDIVFSDASFLLQTVQLECPDVATDVTFERDGAVETFDVAPAVITTEAQLDAVIEEPFDVKIVGAMVGVCGITQASDLSMILGCASMGKSLVIVSEAAPDVWAHEWGHVQGLGHRDDCPTNIMHSFEIATNAVNDFERRAFLTPTASFTAPRIVPDPDEVATPVSQRFPPDEPLDVWLKGVVTRPYLSGIPREMLAGAEARAPRLLLAMLDDPKFGGHRSNIVRALGFCGDSRVCSKLIELIERPVDCDDGDCVLTFDDFGTVAESFLALGRLIAEDSSDVALHYLLDGTDVATWRRLGLSWRYGSYDGDSRDGLLGRLSVLGLSVSGDERAQEHLKEMQAQINRGRPTGDVLADQIDEAVARMQQFSSGKFLRVITTRQP